MMSLSQNMVSKRAKALNIIVDYIPQPKQS